MTRGLAIWIAVGVALIGTLTFIAAAWGQGTSYGIARTGTEAGLRVGQVTWGIPACGQVRVDISTPEAYMLAHPSVLVEGQPIAWADIARCTAVMNSNHHLYTKVRRCHIIVHEWFHLRWPGRPHSLNERSVIYGDDMVSEYWDSHNRRWVAFGAFRACYKILGERYPSVVPT